MNYKELKELSYRVGDLKVSASQEALSIENKEGELVRVCSVEELDKLKDVLYDIKYWWEDLKKEEK